MNSVVPLKEKTSFKILTTQAEHIYVWPLVGKRIVHDRFGHIYLARWQKDVAATPRRRSGKKWSQNEVMYIRFSEGIIGLERGLIQALTQGSDKIVEYSELEKILKEVQGSLHEVQSLNQPLTSQLKRMLMQTVAKMEQATAQPTVEATGQLKYCVTFKDSRGRLNIGVLSCRISTANVRIRERLETLNAWSTSFHESLFSLGEIRDSFYTFVKRLKSSLVRDRKEVGDFKEMTPASARFIKGKVQVYLDHLTPWLHIEPFTAWAFYVHDDLSSIITRLDMLRPEMLEEIYFNLETAIECKLIQKKIFKLIEQISSKTSVEELKVDLEKIACALEQLDDSKLRHRVVEKALYTLRLFSLQQELDVMSIKAELKELATIF